MKHVLPLSPSGILDYNGCPKRYFETKILKKYKFEVTEAITYGNTVHEQLERYVKYSEPLPEHLEKVEPIFHFLRDGGYTLYAELEMAIRRDWTPTTFWDNEGYLRGKIDLIAIRGTDAVVVDYKSGKRKPDPFQLQVYGSVVKQVLGLTTVEAYYLWLKTNETDKFTIDDQNFAEIRADITGQIDKIEASYAEQDFPARPSPLCPYCPALDSCKDAVYYKAQRDRRNRK